MIRNFDASDTEWLVDRHQALYAADEGFDDTFGPLVRSILEAFVADHNPDCEAGWIAEEDGQKLGSIFCVRHDQTTAKLRLFLLMPEARGRGLGRRMLDHCMSFAHGAGYSGMTLWTHESHRAACALYARRGWQLRGARPVTSFGRSLVEQNWAYRFDDGQG